MFTPGEDHWTWITTEGRTFENVIPVEIVAQRVVIEHREGRESIPLDQLDANLRASLIRDLEQA